MWDTIVVRTVRGSGWGGDARLVADLRIGQTDGPDEYLFGRVASIAVSPDGIISAFDAHVRALRAYAPNGRFVRSIVAKARRPGRVPPAPERTRNPLAIVIALAHAPSLYRTRSPDVGAPADQAGFRQESHRRPPEDAGSRPPSAVAPPGCLTA